jgi:single-stranded-DNA-specific exonuclease
LECPDLWRSGLDLAAVGTVADIMPLMDENRAIVQAGLQRMEAAPRLGLTALLEALEVSARPLRSAAIAYRIAPALNAAGRMGDSLSGVECLTARDEVRARAKAAHLVRLNQERRTTEREVAERLNDLLVQEPERLAHPVLVVEGADWHPGVLGILAARLSEELLRPVVVLSADGEEAETAPIVYKGSARSYGRFNIYEALQSAAGILLQFGGHEQAAGLEVHAADLPALQAALDQYAFDHPEQGRFPVPPELIYDLTVQPEVLTLEAVRSLEALEPFGRGNREPVLRLGPVAVSSVRTIGKDQNHLKFRLPSGNGWLDVVAFGFGEYIQLLSPGVAVELCGSPSINTWNGQESVQILAKDLRPVTSGPDDEAQQQELDARFAAAPSGLSPEQLAARLDVAVAELTIGKEAWGGVYLFLKSALRSGYGMARTDVLLERVNERLSRPISHFQLRRILSVYEEAGLLYISESSGGIISVSLRRVEQKVDLYQTPTYLKMQGGGA